MSLNSLGVLLRRGPTAAQDFLANCHRLRSGYSIPKSWQHFGWRENLRVPERRVEELFPEVDFSVCPELVFPLSRDLGVSTEELAILANVVRCLASRRVVEFGTAEGRTAVNLALHLPEGGDLITLDFPPIPGKNDVGYFYWDHPAKARIRQLFCGVAEWDSREFVNSADLVFCDACDLMPGLGAELFQAITVAKPGTVIFRHDYGSVSGATQFWNWVAERLPAFHVSGTTLVCLRLSSDEVFTRARQLLSDPILTAAMSNQGQ